MDIEKIGSDYVILILKLLIEQIEAQNATSISINELKTCVYNIENNVIVKRGDDIC